MKYLLLVCLFVALSRVSAVDDVNILPRREGRLFSSFFSALARWWSPPGVGRCGHPDTCPVHHCRFDDAVIHGFCCGCARVTDRVPIQCPVGIQCPPSPHPLCDDYDYIMECCC